MFNPLMAKAVERVKKEFPRLESVLEFGNQRLDQSLHTMNVRSTSEFYESLGFNVYASLDVNEKMGSTIWDLNILMSSKIKFDLVTDNGTGEHVFNQYSVWDNAHRLCSTEGVIIKIMPFTPWINHGFYNFNPIIYRDVAAVNNYHWVFFWIWDRENNPVDLPIEYDSWVFEEKKPEQLSNYVHGHNWQTDLYMVAAWQKTHVGNFRAPIQGKYIKDIEDDKLRDKYHG